MDQAERHDQGVVVEGQPETGAEDQQRREGDRLGDGGQAQSVQGGGGLDVHGNLVSTAEGGGNGLQGLGMACARVHKRWSIVTAARTITAGGATKGRSGADRDQLGSRPVRAPGPPTTVWSVAQFRLQGSKVLAVDMTGDAVKAKNGAMVAYDGQMSFKKMTGGGEGLRGMVTRRLTGEQMAVMEVKGHGTCYFADRASEINLVRLQGEKLYVEASNLLCTDAALRTGTTFTGMRGASQGNGLFTTTVEGTGQAAITSDGPAVVLRVTKQYPLQVDPGAYIAHTGGLKQHFQSGVNFRTLIGEGSGEAFQIRFEGEGLVYVQPSERNTVGGEV
ncbi:hypothetical protein T261_2663 [Streptomyces lydicus]|nr:hypothetical protein T261_2663 [Streptomyces lydicus]